MARTKVDQTVKQGFEMMRGINRRTLWGWRARRATSKGRGKDYVSVTVQYNFFFKHGWSTHGEFT